MGWWWVQQLAPGMVDPIFLCEMAERLGKTIQEMTTGEPGMSAHELTVIWPEYLAYRGREAERQARKQEERSRRVR
jgi:hypothetical protein